MGVEFLHFIRRLAYLSLIGSMRLCLPSVNDLCLKSDRNQGDALALDDF